MKYIFLQLIFICSVLVTGQQDEIAIVEDGRSSYSIRLSGTASVWDSLAAEELQKYVIEISGAAIPIVGDSHPASEREIIIGNNRTYSDIDVSGIHHRNGFLIK